MKKRIAGITTAVLALSLIMPSAVRADDSTPPDAPYQMPTAEQEEADLETLEAEPVPVPEPDNTTPTLPTAYYSPITPIEPETTVAVSEVIPTTSTATVVRRPLMVNLVSTFTIQSMRQSTIWTTL